MPMNKVKGNMYPWVTHTWNPIRGKCPHQCSYCYMKRFKVGELRLEEKELKTNLGEGNTIFVGSSTDMFAEDVYNPWITRILHHCIKYPKNTYLFQTKNPDRFRLYPAYFEKMSVILGTTIETNADTIGTSNAKPEHDRYIAMKNLDGYKKMVSIEPIMAFNEFELVYMIKKINPIFVSIGADSQGHNLPEPSSEQVRRLIEKLRKFTEVKLKDNLYRIMSDKKGD